MYCLGLGVKKSYGQAVRWFEQAVASGDVRGKAGLAWLLATCPDGRIRDGQRAIEVLWPVVDGGERDPALLDVLAAACAEAGLFPDAVRLVAEAIEQVGRTSERALYEQMARRLRFYRGGKAWREPPEEMDAEELPDDEEEERGPRALKASSNGRRIAPAKPAKADRRDKPVQSARRGKKTERPMQRKGPKEEPASKAAAAPSSGPTKKVKARGVHTPAEAKTMPTAAPKKPAAVSKKPVKVSEKPAAKLEKPAAVPTYRRSPHRCLRPPCCRKPSHLPGTPSDPRMRPVCLSSRRGTSRRRKNPRSGLPHPWTGRRRSM